MKRIINNKVYDTDTAIKTVGTYDNGYTVNDFVYFRETLYRKKTGEYFLHGEGHGNSRYGVWHGNSGGWGEKIMPMTPIEAREWAEEHLTADEYIAEFGEPEESEITRVPLNLTILPTTKVKLEKMRQEQGKSISQIIDELINKM